MTRKSFDRPDIGKSPTGIPGLDEITFGGLPTGRTTLVTGGPGSGKTLLGVSFLVNGAQSFAEPGVLVTFEAKSDELAQDVRSLGYDLNRLIAQRKLLVDYVDVDREFNFDGLLVRLEKAISAIGARRLMLDSIETLLGGINDAGVLRAQLRRLFRWLRDRGITTVVTAGRGEQMLAREGFEEFITDTVIALDHRVHEQISTRRIRVVKYRGSTHGTNEYPFVIDRDGFTVLPVTSLRLEHPAPDERIASGLPALDGMLGGKGFYRGSTILLSGAAGAGKTTFAAHFVDAACARGEKCLYFLFEESPQQMIRNMRAAGVDVSRWVAKGLLRFHADRPSRHGLETHLLAVHQAVEVFEPDLVVMDPITNLMAVGTAFDVRTMLTRVVDLLKTRGITAMFTSLTASEQAMDPGEPQTSSLVDTWILIGFGQQGQQRTRQLSVLKSRGMAHSDEVHPFRFTAHGIEIDAGKRGARRRR